jgi:hypothetical protein
LCRWRDVGGIDDVACGVADDCDLTTVLDDGVDVDGAAVVGRFGHGVVAGSRYGIN